jgi:tRNA/rRNA methyltransferase
MLGGVLAMLLASIRTRFILTQTHHPGNVGAAARAMKTMGFGELILVSPKDPKVLNRKRTKEGASGAVDVLESARVVDTLAEALEGLDVRCATGMPADMSLERKQQVYVEPRPYFYDLINTMEKESDEFSSSIAIVFGNERFGMSSEDFELCDVVLGIPTNPSFGSLNLASAVQLIAYDWREALGGFPSEESCEEV